MRRSASGELKSLKAGISFIVRQMAAELTTWFPQHADSMDAALAMHLQRVGYNPATGSIAHPEMQAVIGKRRPFHSGPIASSSR